MPDSLGPRNLVRKKACSSASNIIYRNTEYTELEETHKDHLSPAPKWTVPGDHTHSPGSTNVML